MSDRRTPPAGDTSPLGTIEIGNHLPGLAVVSMRGEHDLSTTPELTQALEQAAACPNVLVDLSECTFMDSSVVNTLVAAHQDLAMRSVRLEIVIPPDARLAQRVARLTHLANIVAIHETPAAAMTSPAP